MHSSSPRRLATALVVAGLVAGSAAAQVEHLTARLTGDQQVPPVASAALGWATVQVDTGSGRTQIFCHVEGLTPVAAHLHLGAAGQNGGVMVGLSGGPANWTGTGTLNATQVQAVLSAGTYINVHTQANPGGEIRGQVHVPTSSRFVAACDGSQEVPPSGSSATGTFIGFLHEPDDVLVYELDIQGLAARAAHIHVGAVGQNGGVVVPLNGGGTRYCGVSGRLSAQTIADLRSGGMYVNVHTAAFPGGEIRGQVSEMLGSWRADLDGSQENPPVNTPAFGTGCLTLNADRSLSYRVETSGLTATAAHIHLGAVGTNGGVVFPLAGGPTLFQGTTAVLSDAQFGDLTAGRYYINVHTAANPGGEIRGQIGAGVEPTTFGGGCPQTGGSTPEIGASGAACPGTSFDVTLSGASAAAPAFLLMGVARGGAGGVPLDLGLINATGCFALITPLAQGGSTATDTLGCASASLPVPFGVNLSGELLGQWFVIDASANPAGLATSNALAIPLR